MSKPRDFHKANVQIAYPWPVDAEMPVDVTGMGIGIDETLYGEPDNDEPDAEA